MDQLTVKEEQENWGCEGIAKIEIKIEPVCDIGMELKQESLDENWTETGYNLYDDSFDVKGEFYHSNHKSDILSKEVDALHPETDSCSNQQCAEQLNNKELSQCVKLNSLNYHLDYLMQHVKQDHSRKYRQRSADCTQTLGSSDISTADSGNQITLTLKETHVTDIHTNICNSDDNLKVKKNLKNLLDLHKFCRDFEYENIGSLSRKENFINYKTSCESYIETFSEIQEVKNKDDVSSHKQQATVTITCNLCNRQFGRRTTLKSHMLTHTGEKPFSCDICSFKCSRKSGLVLHLRTHFGIKPFSCEICDFKSSHRRNLITHMRTHTGEKPFSCDICSFKSTQKSNLISHRRTHTGERPFSCDLCNYKCANKASFARHLRTHTGEKPFSCTLCNYKCNNHNGLVLHTRTHTGEKPFSCQLCNYKCAYKSSLLIHMRTHTGEKPYLCKLCNYKCAHKTSLAFHMRSHTAV